MDILSRRAQETAVGRPFCVESRLRTQGPGRGAAEEEAGIKRPGSQAVGSHKPAPGRRRSFVGEMCIFFLAKESMTDTVGTSSLQVMIDQLDLRRTRFSHE